MPTRKYEGSVKASQIYPAKKVYRLEGNKNPTLKEVASSGMDLTKKGAVRLASAIMKAAEDMEDNEVVRLTGHIKQKRITVLIPTEKKKEVY